MEIHLNNCIIHDDNFLVICTIDHTNGDLHNDQTYFDIKIYIWEHLELELKSKLKLANMYAYVNLLHYTPPFL